MKKMYGSIILAAVLAISFLLTNCSNTSTDPIEDDNINQSEWELEGSWAGSHFEFVSQADTSQKVDLSSYGVSYSMVVNADSSYSSNISFLGQTTAETGKITIVGNLITLTTTNFESRTGTYEITSTGASIVINDEEFDFDQDGNDEPAFLYIDLQKI